MVGGATTLIQIDQHHLLQTGRFAEGQGNEAATVPDVFLSPHPLGPVDVAQGHVVENLGELARFNVLFVGQVNMAGLILSVYAACGKEVPGGHNGRLISGSSLLHGFPNTLVMIPDRRSDATDAVFHPFSRHTVGQVAIPKVGNGGHPEGRFGGVGLRDANHLIGHVGPRSTNYVHVQELHQLCRGIQEGRTVMVPSHHYGRPAGGTPQSTEEVIVHTPGRIGGIHRIENITGHNQHFHRFPVNQLQEPIKYRSVLLLPIPVVEPVAEVPI
jgi:hypothetical protein